MTISILALKGKLNGKILLLRVFLVGYIYTIRQKFSNLFNRFFFMIKYANVFDKRFIRHVLHNFTFRDHFARFSYVRGFQRDV